MLQDLPRRIEPFLWGIPFNTNLQHECYPGVVPESTAIPKLASKWFTASGQCTWLHVEKADLNIQDLLRRMEALLEAAPPTTAYNRTAILALYQTALQPPSLPSKFFQAPAGAPNAAYTAEMQGFQGGNPIIPAPVAGQVSRVISS